MTGDGFWLLCVVPFSLECLSHPEMGYSGVGLSPELHCLFKMVFIVVFLRSQWYSTHFPLFVHLVVMIVNLKKPLCQYKYICSTVFFFFLISTLYWWFSNKVGHLIRKKKRKEISPQLSKNIETNSRFSSSNLRGRDSTYSVSPSAGVHSLRPPSVFFFFFSKFFTRSKTCWHIFKNNFLLFLAPLSGMQGLPLSARGRTHKPWSWSTES